MNLKTSNVHPTRDVRRIERLGGVSPQDFVGFAIDIIKSRRHIDLLAGRNAGAILEQSYSCCIAAEDKGCQSTVQHIPAQIDGPLQTRLGWGLLITQFGIDNHHSDLLSWVVSVFDKIRLHHIAKLF